ncbi:MAG: tRNA 4-thiouridine(8) synthase ThiI [Spirochaetales bacterium]|nr:tRNA 4-thiouridine(8) synthase ThiI [Spirochaetales bacterium]
MSEMYLIKIGEISLKKGNKKMFERVLKENIKAKFRGYKNKVIIRSGRYYLEVEDCPDEVVSRNLGTTFGIVAFYKTLFCGKSLEEVTEKAIQVAKANLEAGRGSKFKVETRRIDKSLPLDSYAYSSEIGGALLDEFSELEVDVRNPDWIVHVELREQGYVYGFGERGAGGLPVGTAGRAVLLLSGGIDSPVAGYLIGKRGVKLSAVYFHTPPYTSDDAMTKVKDLAAGIAPWSGGMKLWVVNFTEVQMLINKSVPPEATTLHSRAAMMKIAQMIAFEESAGALITGEALSQVASQTMESLRFTGSAVTLPVLRPCIGMDKEEIIKISRKLDLFETSTRPFDDCCTLFSPEHPLIRPDFETVTEQHGLIDDLESHLKKACQSKEGFHFS